MKKLNAALLTMCVAVLAACGGGDKDEAGSPTAFSAVPDEITLTGPDADTCGAGYAGRIFVYGGSAPYRIDNTLPDYVVVTPNKVDSTRDGNNYFDVTYTTAACLENIPLVIVDALGKKIEISLNSVKGTD
jgi:hypothetical protein